MSVQIPRKETLDDFRHKLTRMGVGMEVPMFQQLSERAFDANVHKVNDVQTGSVHFGLVCQLHTINPLHAEHSAQNMMCKVHIVQVCRSSTALGAEHSAQNIMYTTHIVYAYCICICCSSSSRTTDVRHARLQYA